MDSANLDYLGRIRIKRELLNMVNWRAGVPLQVDITTDGCGLEIRLSRDVCAHCFNSNPYELIKISEDSRICFTCLEKAQGNLQREKRE